MGHNKLDFDEVKDYRKVGSFPLRQYRFGEEKVNKNVEFGAIVAISGEITGKTEKKT
jgi:hypothetical protein